MDRELWLITGATGLVGSHVALQARRQGLATRALVRNAAEAGFLRESGVELVTGDLTDPAALARACAGVTHVVHCAAKVGDWGPVADYRRVNVEALAHLAAAARAGGRLQRFVHISSLGVYEARDHHGTDEAEPPARRSLDGYTQTKLEAEELLQSLVAAQQFPVTILRPGFIYGPRDRTVLPKLLERLRAGQVRYFGSGEQLLNNTYVGNLTAALWQAVRNPRTVGATYNITDGRLVTRREYLTTIARLAGCPEPSRRVPLWLARPLVAASEAAARLWRRQTAPLLSKARYKFLALHLDFSISKAKAQFGYTPPSDFQDAIRETLAAETAPVRKAG